jgi:hypothetical protein
MVATDTARKPTKTRDDQGPIDYLQGALHDLTKARERARGDIRVGIESAIDHTRDAIKEAGAEAQDQIAEWERSLEKAGDDVRRELGVMAVRAQRSPEALRAMSAEIRKRKAEISPSR